MNKVEFDRKLFRKLHDHNGGSLHEIQRITGITNQYLSKLNREKISNPSFVTVGKIAKYFNVPINLFLKESS